MVVPARVIGFRRHEPGRVDITAEIPIPAVNLANELAAQVLGSAAGRRAGAIMSLGAASHLSSVMES